MTRRFVALDRDGTVMAERHHLTDPRAVEVLPGVVAGLRGIRALGLGLILVTNQSVVGRGLCDAARLATVHRRLLDLLEAEDVELDGIYYCPHTPTDRCMCRKPATGLLEQAARDLHFDPGAGFVIGDKRCDIELGQRVGATTLLVRTGYGAQVAAERTAMPDYIIGDLSAAPPIIEQVLAREQKAVGDVAQR